MNREFNWHWLGALDPAQDDFVRIIASNVPQRCLDEGEGNIDAEIEPGDEPLEPDTWIDYAADSYARPVSDPKLILKEDVVGMEESVPDLGYEHV